MSNGAPLGVLSFFIRTFVRLLFALLFIAAGIIHLRDPGLFLPVMPPWIPFPLACILVSGCAELAGGVGLLIPSARWRRSAGWGLAWLLVAVFPANIYMAVEHIQIHGFPAHAWEAWARLPVQIVFLVGVLWATNAWHSTCREGMPDQN